MRANDFEPWPCFLDIGPGSFYDFQSLEIGGGLTSTNFVLVDGEYAAQTRKKGFDHNPQKIFSWLDEKVLERFGRKKSDTGIIVINAPKSKMELYYNMQHFTGKELLLNSHERFRKTLWNHLEIDESWKQSKILILEGSKGEKASSKEAELSFPALTFNFTSFSGFKILFQSKF